MIMGRHDDMCRQLLCARECELLLVSKGNVHYSFNLSLCQLGWVDCWSWLLGNFHFCSSSSSSSSSSYTAVPRLPPHLHTTMSSNAVKYQGCLSIAGIRHNCLRGIQAAPVVLLWLVFGWCFYAYIIRLCGGLLHDGQLAQGFNNMSCPISIRLHLRLYHIAFFRHPVYRIFPATLYLMHMEFLEGDQYTSRSTC